MKSNVIPILKDHFATFRNERTGGASASDYVFYLAVPAVLAVISYWQAWRVQGLTNLLTAVSILAGLLFNLLVLLFDTVSKLTDDDTESAEHERRLAREIEANVTYTLLVALALACALGAIAFAANDAIPRSLSAILVFALAHFALTLGMVVKRIRAAFLAVYNRPRSRR